MKTTPNVYFFAAVIAAICASFVDKTAMYALLIGVAGLLIMGVLAIAIRRTPSRTLRGLFALTGLVTFSFGMAILGRFLQ